MDKQNRLIDRWKNRRKMAWISLFAGLTYPLLVLFTESTALGDISVPFYIFVSSVVGAYIGFATMDDKYQSNRNSYSDMDYSKSSISSVDYSQPLDDKPIHER